MSELCKNYTAKVANPKEQLKHEIICEIEGKLKGVVIREDTQSVLSGPRNKWFRGQSRSIQNGFESPMYRVFGVGTFWAVWELIRKLTCFICGVGYVRHLEGDPRAADIADALCEAVYDLRQKYQEAQNDK